MLTEDKNITDFNNIIEDGDYIIRFNDENLAKSFNVKFNSIYAVAVINGELLIKEEMYEEVNMNQSKKKTLFNLFLGKIK